MNDRVADEFGDLVRAAVDAGSWWQGLVGRDVANRAADLSEEFLSCQGVWGCGKVGVAGRRTRVADFIDQAFQFGLVRLCVWGVAGCGAVPGCVRWIFVW